MREVTPAYYAGSVAISADIYIFKSQVLDDAP